MNPLIVDIEVVREQGHNGWFVQPSGRLQVHHKEPESRDANEFVMRALAEKLHISHGHVTIVHGVENHIKRFKIGMDVTKEKLIEILEAKESNKI
jgi:uncharacterized protein YggU (UPF0235/DUF167 family)